MSFRGKAGQLGLRLAGGGDVGRVCGVRPDSELRCCRLVGWQLALRGLVVSSWSGELIFILYFRTLGSEDGILRFLTVEHYLLSRERWVFQ
jgi:hypothetical protein